MKKAFEAQLKALVDDMLRAANHDPAKLVEVEEMVRNAYWRVATDASPWQPDFNKLARRR